MVRGPNPVTGIKNYCKIYGKNKQFITNFQLCDSEEGAGSIKRYMIPREPPHS